VVRGSAVRGGLVHVAQRDSGVERGGGERVAQRVRADLLGDPSAAGDAANNSCDAVPVEAFPVGGEEQRAFGALADGQVDGAGGARGEWDSDDLAVLAVDEQVRWPRSSPRCSMSAPVASETRGPVECE
jgi:hypothetical protein